MKSIGFQKKKGQISEPAFSKEPSIKIGGKFFLGKEQIEKQNNPTANILRNNSSKNMLNTMNSFNSNNSNNLQKLGSFNPRLSNNGYKTAQEKGGFGDGLSIGGDSVMGATNGHGKFGKTMDDFTKTRQMGSRARINCVFNINDPLTMPKFVNEEQKIDPEEQVRNYIEFEKRIIN